MMQKQRNIAEQISDLIYQKGIEYERVLTGGQAVPHEKSRLRIFQNLVNSRISGGTSDFPTTQTQEIGLARIVDNGVMLDPVGKLLYQFSEENKRPGYVSQDWFIGTAKKQWNALGKEGKEKFRNEWIVISDAETRKMLRGYSDEELFDFYRDAKVIYNEKCEALMALLKMSSRQMKEGEYISWANKFGINLGYKPNI